MSKLKKAHRTANILGFSLFSKQKSELLKKIKIHLSSKNKFLKIFTPNAEQLVQAQQNPNFKQYLQQAEVLVPDGISLVWSSRFLSLFSVSKSIQEKISGVDLAQELLKISQDQDLTCLLVGGRDYHQWLQAQLPAAQSSDQPDTINKSAVSTVQSTTIDQSSASLQTASSQLETSQLKTSRQSAELFKHLPFQPLVQPKAGHYWQLGPNLYWTPGYKQVAQATQPEEKRLRAIVQELRPTIVFAAFGAPQQEEWLVSHHDFLEKQGVKLGLAVGGSFDILFGRLSRAPRWLRFIGLEWLYRLIQEPWRWQRQTRLLRFVVLVSRQWWSQLAARLKFN